EVQLAEPGGVEPEIVPELDLPHDVLVSLSLGEAAGAWELIEEPESHGRYVTVGPGAPSTPPRRRAPSAAALSSKSARAASSGGEKSPPGPTVALTRSGPAIWPPAKAAVIAAISTVAPAPPTARASCIPAMVFTMKVPPTSSAAAMSPPRPGQATGAAAPNAMTTLLTAQSPRSPRRRTPRAASRVEPAAGAPNAGQAHPKTSGSATRARAIEGTNVAGMM